jgi:hypothetical protein
MGVFPFQTACNLFCGMILPYSPLDFGHEAGIPTLWYRRTLRRRVLAAASAWLEM